MGPPLSPSTAVAVLSHRGVEMNRLVAAVVLHLLAAIGAAPTAQATFSGENGRIFYVSGALTAFSAVRSVCPDGTHGRVVVSPATYPSPSPDGTKIAYVNLVVIGNSLVDDGIWVANADGSDPVRISSNTLSPVSPTWSPDGTKLTFRQYVFYPGLGTSVMQPVVADVATKVVTPLLSDQAYSIATAQTATNVWSPDGTQIYFPGTTAGGAAVYRVAAGGGAPTLVLGADGGLPFTQAMDVSPDGASLIVQQQVTWDPDALSEIRIHPAGGGAGFLVTGANLSQGTGDEDASFAPDGTRIVFNRVSDQQIMTAALDGSNALPVGTARGAHARWSTNFDDCTDPGAVTMKINEVALGAARFIELLDPADEAFPTDQGPYKVVVYDGAGARMGAHTISTALLQGRDNTVPLLLSTAAADAAFGVSGDEVLSQALPEPGHACFTKGAGETRVDCVSWGCITGTVSASSTRIPAPGAGQSAQRQGVASTTFHVAAPTPKAPNVAGVTAAVCVPELASGPSAAAALLCLLGCAARRSQRLGRVHPSAPRRPRAAQR